MYQDVPDVLHQETTMDITDIDLLQALALAGDPRALQLWQDALASGVGDDLTPVPVAA